MQRLTLVIAVCSVLGLSNAARVSNWATIKPVQDEWAKPWFCHDLDCPQYESKKNISLGDGTMSVELRHYPAAKWVTTTVDSTQYDKAVAQGFFRLFKYISGENTAETKIAMTAPVAVKVVPGQGPECNTNFSVGFFIPYEHQANPPEPTSEYVHITTMSATDVYVYGFGGFATGNRWVETSAKVTDALQAAGYAIEPDFYLTAAYDSPFRLLNRHNEVWIVAGTAPSSH